MREQEQRTRTILESITDAFFGLGRDWRFTYVNRQAEVLLGRTRDDLLGKNIWEEFAPAVGTDFDRSYRRAVAENVTVTFEAFYPPHDRWYEVHAYPSPDGLSVYFRDVGERKRAEIALREQRAAVPPTRRRHAADRLDGPTGRRHRLPEPPLARVHRAAGDGGERRLGANPPPRRRPARRRALGGFRPQRRHRSRWRCGSWIGGGRPTAGISSEPWPSTTRRDESPAGSGPARTSTSRSGPRSPPAIWPRRAPPWRAWWITKARCRRWRTWPCRTSPTGPPWTWRTTTARCGGWRSPTRTPTRSASPTS